MGQKNREKKRVSAFAGLPLLKAIQLSLFGESSKLIPEQKIVRRQAGTHLQTYHVKAEQGTTIATKSPTLASRPQYPDRRLIPASGDTVFRMIPAFGGAGYEYGTVYYDGRTKALRVRSTSTRSLFEGKGAGSGRTYALTPAWAVENDPELKRREEDAKRKRAEEKRTLEEEIERNNTMRELSFQAALAAGHRPLSRVTYADNIAYVSTNQKPYPEGEERTRINRAFDSLFQAVRSNNALAKALFGIDRD